MILDKILIRLRNKLNHMIYDKYFEKQKLVFEHSFMRDDVKVSIVKDGKFLRYALIENIAFRSYRNLSIDYFDDERIKHIAYWVKKLPKNIYEDLTKEIQYEGFRQI